MLFKDFCKFTENLKNPKEAREQIAELLTMDDPVTICNFLMGQPLGNKKIGISKQIVGNFLLENDIPINKFTNLGEAAASLNYDSSCLTLMDVKDLYIYLTKGKEKKKNLETALKYFDDLERKYFVNILVDSLQNQIGWGVIKHSVAQFLFYDVIKVDEIYKRTQSIEKTISILNLEEEDTGIFYPVMSQLSKEMKLDIVKYSLYGECKLDGFRAQVHVKDSCVKIFSGRNISSEKTNFPDVESQVCVYPNGIYDGEILGYRGSTLIPFVEFQCRINAKKGIDELVVNFPAKFIAFDLLHDGYNFILHLPYEERRKRLEKTTGFITDRHFIENKEQALNFYNTCIDAGYEGIMLKTPDGLYLPGEGKSSYKGWSKYKPARLTYDCVIINAQWGTGKNLNTLASFEIAVLDENIDPIESTMPLRSVGWVGSGFSECDMAELTCKIAPFGHIPSYDEMIDLWIVIEIKADLFLDKAFRFPRYLGTRDKKEINCIEDLLV